MLLHNDIRIGETYVVESFLGEGAFGEVYRVKHAYLGIQAMKVFKYAGVIREQLLGSMGEPLMLSAMRHPNIVGVYDANVFSRVDLSGDVFKCSLIDGKQYGYYTMDYIPTTLHDYWRSFKSQLVPVSEVVDIIRQVCCGVGAMHRHRHESNPPAPILHRDIKPANILLLRSGGATRAVLSDFGLAKAANPMAIAASLQGTPDFKPPESFRDRTDTPVSDVWAIGVTFYMLLTDRLPYKTGRTISRQTDYSQPLVKPSVYNPMAPPEIDQFVTKALSLNPFQRYADAQEMFEALPSGVPDKPLEVIPTRPKAVLAQPQLGKPATHPTETTRTGAKLRLKQLIVDTQSGARSISNAAELLEQLVREEPWLKSAVDPCLRYWSLGQDVAFKSGDPEEIVRDLMQNARVK